LHRRPSHFPPPSSRSYSTIATTTILCDPLPLLLFQYSSFAIIDVVVFVVVVVDVAAIAATVDHH
jgi:hypothetical protein